MGAWGLYAGHEGGELVLVEGESVLQVRVGFVERAGGENVVQGVHPIPINRHQRLPVRRQNGICNIGGSPISQTIVESQSSSIMHAPKLNKIKILKKKKKPPSLLHRQDGELK